MRAFLKPAILAGLATVVVATLSSCTTSATSHISASDLREDLRLEEYRETNYSHECRTCHDQEATYFVKHTVRDDPGLLSL